MSIDLLFELKKKEVIRKQKTEFVQIFGRLLIKYAQILTDYQKHIFPWFSITFTITYNCLFLFSRHLFSPPPHSTHIIQSTFLYWRMNCWWAKNTALWRFSRSQTLSIPPRFCATAFFQETMPYLPRPNWRPKPTVHYPRVDALRAEPRRDAPPMWNFGRSDW